VKTELADAEIPGTMCPGFFFTPLPPPSATELNFVTSMRYRFLPLQALLMLVVSSAIPALAQQDGVSVGPKAGFYIGDGNPMIGLIAEYPLNARVSIVPGVEFIPGVDETTRLVFDGNIHYQIPLRGSSTRPFLLGGAGIRFDHYRAGSGSDVSFRINLGAGVAFNTTTPVRPWVGFKLYLLDATTSDFLLQGGVSFVL
jgi:hypothetical protein